ncbi:cupin [Streptomyces violaceusniger]|uniref:Cupin n=2 Tax=Streptomyces TaxID=1883 RepID=A0A4D4L399_STRVO|nr:cupin [Streptomyces violaceusniger]
MSDMATTRRPATAEWLGLEPHPEGGWYRETWRSDVTVRPPGYEGERATATAIYFLLTPGEESRWHVVRSAELWLWHSGGPLRLRLGGTGDAPEAAPTEVLLGRDIASGQRPQVVIPPGVWQAARPEADEEVLVSCVVSPGFDFADFRLLED